MVTRKFRVYNQTRKSFLGVEVILADASEEHLDTLIGNLALQAGEGLWLKPCRRIPQERALPLFGLIFLDQESCVLQVVELFPGLGPEPMEAQAASALVLSVGAILASRTRPGDQLVIDAREQRESPSAASISPAVPAVAPVEEEQETEPPLEEPQPEENPALAFPEEQLTEPAPEEPQPWQPESESPQFEELQPEEPQSEEPQSEEPQSEKIHLLAFAEAHKTERPHEEPQSDEVPASPPPDDRTLKLQRAIQELQEREAAAEAPPKKDSLKNRFLRWLDAEQKPPEPVDRRLAHRTPLPGLVAFYWTGGNPHPYRVADISESGLFLVTGDRSSPGTIFMLTLQRTDSDGEHLGDAISVYGEVVRWGADGVGFEFIPSKPVRHGRGYSLPGNPADQNTLNDFVQRLNMETNERHK